MIAAATIPMTGHQTPTPPAPRRRKAWKPDDSAHMIYRWVKFEGKTQDWVASAQRVSQGTVSRIIQRYEKWLAHAQPGADGQLNPDERLRAQRWLTYERNELILASALRIAGDMEGFTDVSKITMTLPTRQTEERETRTFGTLDRTGVAARFLRLAFRINMEQLKLVEMEPLAPLPSLPADEFDEEEGSGAAEAEAGDDDEDEDESAAVAEAEDEVEPESKATSGAGDDPAAQEQEPSPAGAHNAHNCSAAESGASANAADSCAGLAHRKKSDWRA